MTNDVKVNAANTPGVSKDFKLSDLRPMTEEERLDLQEKAIAPNETPVYSKGQDPLNWYDFEQGNSDVFAIGVNSDGGTQTLGYGTFANMHPLRPEANIQATFNGKSLEFHYGPREDGPRKEGYMSVSKTWMMINDNVPETIIFPKNYQVWKTGAIQLTIRPQSENCVLLSGGLDGRSSSNGVGDGLTFVPVKFNNFYSFTNDPVNKFQSVDKTVRNEEEGVATSLIGYWTVPPVSTFVSQPSLADGITLSDSLSIPRYFEVKIVDGYVNIVYVVLYGNSRKNITITSKTKIVDGKWHHLVINRPTKNTKINGSDTVGENGAIEIWIDGKLDTRSYDITSKDIVPTPHILFNSIINPGIISSQGISFQGAGGFNSNFNNEQLIEQEKTNYVGDIKDYIFGSNNALSSHEINLLHTYALLSSPESKILKSGKMLVSAVMPDATVNTNSKKVLKLYWNNLISNPEKTKNGLEFDNNFDVYSYSITKNNLISTTETFNLNLVDQVKTRTFAANVKTAIVNNLQTLKPGVVLNSAFKPVIGDSALQADFGGRPQYRDVLNESEVLWQTSASNWTIKNMQYGGVELEAGDRLLLTGQHKPSQNGIYEFVAQDKPLKRVPDVDESILENLHVYVEQGNYAGKTFVQTEKVTHLRKSKQLWFEIDSESALSTLNAYPIHTSPWLDNYGNQRFIDVNSDIAEEYDIIAFMNYPDQSSDIFNAFENKSDSYNKQKYAEFIESLKLAVQNGKSLYVSSPILAVDLGIVSAYEELDQLIDESGDAQSAAISPFESGEPAENYYDTHRNMKYQLVTEIPGLTDTETYLMTDFVTYSPDRTNSDYHIKYSYRQFGIQEGDEFYIPGLTTVPETVNLELPAYRFNQKNIKPIVAFKTNDIIIGTPVTELSNIIYDGDTPVNNPFDDYVTTIAVEYGDGKMFVNCVEDGYAFSREEYNRAIIQNVEIGENAETAQTAAWQYSTKRIQKKNLYDFSDVTNVIGQTTPTDGGGGPIVQSQSHSSNGMIRNLINKDDLRYQSDQYADFTEEVFETTEIPVLSMTWLGLKWLAE